MHGFSTVDGFVEITECFGEMIKYVANEPSVGLFYVQQHTQNAVPNIINLENNVVEKSRESTLHTEDLEDSITVVRSMKECGFPIADEMIRDIKKSLAIMSKKQPKRGLIRNPISGFQMGRSSSWGPATWGYAQKDDEPTSGYFSTVFRSAKQKASNFKWPQLDSADSIQTEGEKLVSYHNSPLSVTPTGLSSTSIVLDTEADELPLSSPVAGELEDEIQVDDDGLPGHEILSVSENFDDFKADKEAKLQEWLEGTSNSDASIRRRASDAEGPSA